MEEVKLIGNYTSPFNRRVIWALKLKGIQYEFIEEDLDNKSELLLKSNPIHKTIPVLLHNGKAIPDSTIILQYIEDTWPEKPLLPKDSQGRAKARFWMKFMDDKMPITYSLLSLPGEAQDKAMKNCSELLTTIEEQALDGDNKFLGGDNIGLPDLIFGFIAYQWELVEEVVGVKLLEPQRFPRLHAWIQNFKSDPVIKENLPNRDMMKARVKFRWESMVGPQ